MNEILHNHSLHVEWINNVCKAINSNEENMVGYQNIAEKNKNCVAGSAYRRVENKVQLRSGKFEALQEISPTWHYAGNSGFGVGNWWNLA